MREVEVKFRVASAASVIAACGARGIQFGAAVRQDDQAYAPRDWSYGDARLGVAFLRLRTMSGGGHTFTLKQPAVNALACVEHETAVADRDAMHAAILAMGFWPTTRIMKTRRTAAIDQQTLCLDEVDGLGVFLEVERMITADVDAHAAQSDMARFVESLDVDAARTMETYDTLIRDAELAAATR